MNNILTFFEPCVPPTITSQQRRHKYKQTDLKRAEAFWQAVMERHAPEKPVTGALVLKVFITYPHTGKSRAQYKGLPVPKLTVPDCDNANKLIQDAMQKCKYFKNDAHIYDLQVKKWFGDMPGICIKLYPDPEWDFLFKKKKKKDKNNCAAE